jgi:hypothetical protein
MEHEVRCGDVIHSVPSALRCVWVVLVNACLPFEELELLVFFLILKMEPRCDWLVMAPGLLQGPAAAARRGSSVHRAHGVCGTWWVTRRTYGRGYCPPFSQNLYLKLVITWKSGWRWHPNSAKFKFTFWCFIKGGIIFQLETTLPSIARRMWWSISRSHGQRDACSDL